MISQKQIKPKTCKCGIEFQPFNSLDKYCSVLCAMKSANPTIRKPIKRKVTKVKNKISDSQKAFEKVRDGLRADKIRRYGYLYCERCGTKKSMYWNMHHIVFRSEKPRHKHLHDPRNLIDLCDECHILYHAKKGRRLHLVLKRKLTELRSI
jgi:5-methylcytosine-specific restriction endonuclease McrA